jgi:hypothetical protein
VVRGAAGRRGRGGAEQGERRRLGFAAAVEWIGGGGEARAPICRVAERLGMHARDGRFAGIVAGDLGGVVALWER